MVQRYKEDFDCGTFMVEDSSGEWVPHEDYQELEAENARLRQQRDAANAQLDFLIEEMKKAP